MRRSHAWRAEATSSVPSSLRLLDQRRGIEQPRFAVVAAVGLGLADALLGVAVLDVFAGDAVFGQAAAAPAVFRREVEGEHRRPGGDGEGDDLALEDRERVVEGEDRGTAEVGVEDLDRTLADQ